MFKKKNVPYFNPLTKKLDELSDDQLNAISRQTFESYSKEYLRQKGDKSEVETPKLNHDFLQTTLPLVLHESSYRINKTSLRISLSLGCLSLFISLVSLYISMDSGKESSKVVSLITAKIERVSKSLDSQAKTLQNIETVSLEKRKSLVEINTNIEKTNHIISTEIKNFKNVVEKQKKKNIK
ncbi:MAG: hypothetical protein COW01_15785 [Bdellovibrionales bacterium CG12_big_fil_rev_8_21_14_0_65_38_15]|nr:MAG: hypothetical protein COW79_14950 [Bdellovibrionales bacterium CG22_combo_CG10-13_8_21_14_all_38_13]PIQ52430.1 MAG: hypothetical protein COW01_15785 [Bdellovibrionales bacterium CG12_big_fil_rev_8_21_14_0_65_38_15]PIR29468.1 MAG: hypothetical protein COV38_10325 [Bdellovibrionales bacterium CG11_big_fil_rev_8_21_14_0_20_38_13]